MIAKSSFYKPEVEGQGIDKDLTGFGGVRKSSMPHSTTSLSTSMTSLSMSTTSSNTSDRRFLAEFDKRLLSPKYEREAGDESDLLGVGSSKGEEEKLDCWPGVSLDRSSGKEDSLDRLLVDSSKSERLFLD
jgi:hypothetical protein